MLSSLFKDICGREQFMQEGNKRTEILSHKTIKIISRKENLTEFFCTLVLTNISLLRKKTKNVDGDIGGPALVYTVLYFFPIRHCIYYKR